MANAYPATCNITCPDINGNSILKSYTAVKELYFNYFENTINIVDATGSFYFGYSTIATVTITITGGVTAIVIST